MKMTMTTMTMTMTTMLTCQFHCLCQVCLENPELINTAKCSLPRDLCLSNKQFTPLVGCSGLISSSQN